MCKEPELDHNQLTAATVAAAAAAGEAVLSFLRAFDFQDVVNDKHTNTHRNTHTIVALRSEGLIKLREQLRVGQIGVHVLFKLRN